MRASAIDSSSFALPFHVPASSGQVGLAIGDLDVDAKPDVVVANYFSGTVSVYRNRSSGSINSSSLTPPVNFTVGAVPVLVRIADVDGDAKPDLVVVNQSSSSISVLRNVGATGVINSNSFAQKVDFSTATDPRFATLADLDGDGRLDLIVATWGSGIVSIYRNTAVIGSITGNSFGPRIDLSIGRRSVSVEAGDVDGDGRVEIIVAGADRGSISVYWNLSNPGALSTNSFAPNVDFPVAAGPTIALGDIDGDGRLDIIAANQLANTISVLRNTSRLGVITSNSFAAKVDFNTGDYPYSVALADLDMDQKPEVIVANASGHTVSVFRNRTLSPGFTTNSLFPKLDFATGNGPRIVAAADLDGDGLMDLATANLDQASFSILRHIVTNPPPSVTPALVSLWRGENNALDSVGNNNGVLVNNVGFVPGVSGQAFRLDGANFIRVPNSASLSLVNELSWVLWFKRDLNLPAGAAFTLFDKRSGSTANYGANMSQNYGLQLYYNSGSGFAISASSLPPGDTWHHFAGIYRQLSNGVQLTTYIDGVAIRTNTFPGTLTAAANNAPLAIGSARDGAAEYFKGAIDEVALYNYALNAAQVLSNYNSVTPPPPPVQTNMPPLLVSRWRGENNAQDSVGNNHGILVNNVGFVPGVSGQAFRLDGTNFIRVPDSASLSLVNELSWVLWFKRDLNLPAGAAFTLFDKRNPSTANYGANMSQNHGLQLYFDSGGGFAISASALPSGDVWHHFAGTYRQLNSGVQLTTYLDGVPVRTNTLPGTLVTAANNAPLAIGSARDGAAEYFKGAIDEVALYNYALNAAQVLSNYNSSLTGAETNAQTVVVPARYANLDGGTASGSGLLREVARYQDAYAASNFPSAPILIKEVRFRPSAVYGQAFSATISNLQINMSTTLRQPEFQSAIFAQNTGTDDILVFQGAASISSAFVGPPNGPKAFDIVIPLQTPFLYDSSRGNLLIDFRNFSGSSATFIDAGPGVGDGASRVFAANASSTIATSVDTGAEILAFVYEPETNSPPAGSSHFDLARDFSTNRNPNGVWSYGWQTDIGGPLNLLPHTRTGFAGNGVPYQLWEFGAGGEPPIFIFFPFTNTLTGVSSGGQGQYPPGTVVFYAGNDGTVQNFATVRFTAPSNATYRIVVSVRSDLDGSLGGDADFHVAHNSTEIFGQFFSTMGAANYSNTLTLASGDRIEFAVGRGADRVLFGSALKITAVITPNAPANFSVSAAFSSNNNPNGVWSYGWKETLDGSFGLLTLPISARADNGVTVSGWILTNQALPAIYFNPATNTAIIGGGQGVLPPETVWFHPGGNGRPENFGVIRFTAPSNSNYRVETAVESLYSGTLAGDTDFHVVRNGTELFGEFLAARASTNYSNVVTLSAGSHLDFMIGRGADANSTGAGLKIVAAITPTTDAAPVMLIPLRLSPANSFRFQVEGEPRTYVVETSTNLTQWTVVQTSVITNIPGRLIITDSNSPVASQRFYRLRAP